MLRWKEAKDDSLSHPHCSKLLLDPRRGHSISKRQCFLAIGGNFLSFSISCSCPADPSWHSPRQRKGSGLRRCFPPALGSWSGQHSGGGGWGWGVSKEGAKQLCVSLHPMADKGPLHCHFLFLLMQSPPWVKQQQQTDNKESPQLYNQVDLGANLGPARNQLHDLGWVPALSSSCGWWEEPQSQWGCQSAPVEGRSVAEGHWVSSPSLSSSKSALTVMGPSPTLKAPGPLLPFWIKSIPALALINLPSLLWDSHCPPLQSWACPDPSHLHALLLHWWHGQFLPLLPAELRATTSGKPPGTTMLLPLVCHQVLLIPMSGGWGGGVDWGWGNDRAWGSVCFHTCSCYYPLGFWKLGTIPLILFPTPRVLPGY